MSSRPISPELLHPSESLPEFSRNMVIEHQNQHNPDHGLPLPSRDGSLNWPEKIADTATVRYVFWRHTSQNGSTFAEAVDGCDVLAMESMDVADPADPDFSNKKIRRRQTKAILNGLLDAELSPEEERIFEQARATRPISTDKEQERWLSGLGVYGPAMISLRGSGIRVEFVDTDYKHSGRIREEQAEIKNLRNNFINLAHNGANFDELTEAMLAQIDVEARQEAFREKISEKQIEKLIEKYPDSNIAIGYGANHVAMSRLLALPNLRMQRTFLTPVDGFNDFEQFFRTHNAARDTWRGGADIPEDLLEQDVAQRIILVALSSVRKSHANKLFAKYINLGESQEAVVLAGIKDLWSDTTPQNRGKADKRLKETLKIIRSI